jgi:hypothetical protein
MFRGHVQEIVQIPVIRLQHDAACFHTLRQDPGQLNHRLFVVIAFSDTDPYPEVYEQESKHQHSKDRVNLQAQGHPCH